MNVQFHRSASAEDTRKIGADFARTLTPRSIVWLQGPLGAGKTCFVAGVVAGLGGQAVDVASPTYALVHEHNTATGKIFHADLYRLKNPREVVNLGLAECYGRGALLLEWPEMAGNLLGGPTHLVELRSLTDEVREIRISAF